MALHNVMCVSGFFVCCLFVHSALGEVGAVYFDINVVILQNMAKKRIQNRVGDIYYVTLEDGARIYLQYVAIDTEQLYSPGNTNHLTVSHKWYVWTINQKYIHIGDLVGEYKSYSMGFVYPPYAVYQKIITGKYPFHELK